MRYVRIAPLPMADDYLVVPLDELKRHLRIDASDEDETLKVFLRAAIGSVDGPDASLGRVFVPGTFQCLTSGPQYLSGCFAVRMADVRDVTEVAQRTADGTYAAVIGWTWELHSDNGTPIAVIRAPAAGWPAVAAHAAAWRITVAAGPAAAAALPPEVRVAVLLRAAFLYGNRGESNQGGEPPAIGALLAPFQRWSC
jgi:uncharacterized phiE125 gp8 family phage protein